MFCKNCGCKNEEGSKFCSKCGKSVDYSSIDAISIKVRKIHWVWGILALIVAILVIVMILCMNVRKNMLSYSKTDNEEMSESELSTNNGLDQQIDIDMKEQGWSNVTILSEQEGKGEDGYVVNVYVERDSEFRHIESTLTLEYEKFIDDWKCTDSYEVDSCQTIHGVEGYWAEKVNGGTAHGIKIDNVTDTAFDITIYFFHNKKWEISEEKKTINMSNGWLHNTYISFQICEKAGPSLNIYDDELKLTSTVISRVDAICIDDNDSSELNDLAEDTTYSLVEFEQYISDIKTNYYALQDEIERLPEDYTIIEDDISKKWYRGEKLVKVKIVENQFNDDYVREYYYNNGALYFAFLYTTQNASKEQRLYFVKGRLIRWIDNNACTYDQEYNNNDFMNWQDEYERAMSYF